MRCQNTIRCVRLAARAQLCTLLFLVGACGGASSPVDAAIDLTVVPGCGNGVLEDGEECDQGGANSDTAPDACRTSCKSASCGDKVRDKLEECDDGNGWGGDGCTPICTAEMPPLEHEPNDSPSNANPWTAGTIHGALRAADRDCYSFPLAACTSVSAHLVAIADPRHPEGVPACPVPATLTLIDPAGTAQATGAPGADRCAVLDPAVDWGARFVTTPGNWVMCVGGVLGDAVPYYALDIAVIDAKSGSYPYPADQDEDGDGIPNRCDADRDGDGVDNMVDNCPDIPNGPAAAPLKPAKDGFIRQWLTVGTFVGKKSAKDCQPTLENLVAVDDAKVSPSLGDKVANVNEWIVEWSLADRVDFLADYGYVGAPREVYSAVYVRSDKARDLTLGVGPDDGARVWWNGAMVLDITACQGTNVDSSTVKVSLNAGWNTLVIKVYDQGGGWGDYVRFLDAGVPVTDLELSFSPSTWVFAQTDSDGDGVGDMCDKTPK